MGKVLALFREDDRTSQSELHRIQNPAAHFKLDEDIFATGFIIPDVGGKNGHC